MSLLRRTAALLAVTAPLAFTASASALAVDPPAPTAIAGNPMTVWVGSQGQLQGLLAGDTSNIFYSPQNAAGDAGFFLAFPSGTTPAQNTNLAAKVYGFQGAAGPHYTVNYVPRSQAAVTGDGSAGNPFVQVTTYGVNADPDNDPTPAPITDLALVTQTTTYVNGNQTFDTRWDVKNLTAQPLPFKALAAADFYFEGDDHGTGIFTQGPPRFVGGTNADTGRSGGFLEALGGTANSPAWSSYEALAFGNSGDTVWGRVQDAATTLTPTFDTTVIPANVDNAGGVEWDQPLATPLKAAGSPGNGDTASFELVTRTALPAALQFDKTNAGSPQGVPITFVATAKDTSGTAFTGKSIRYSIAGANTVTNAAATIDASGNAALVDPGTNAGPDTLTAFVDLNGNGTREANEPQGSALATFVDNIPPRCTVKVTGDQPVSSGGAGKPLIITVNCDSPATVTTASTLTIQPLAKKVVHHAGRATASAAKRKPKHKKKVTKPKKVVLKLPVVTAAVAPGVAIPVDIKIPATITKKYPGLTAKATVTVTATDAAGNHASVTSTKNIKIAKKKVAKKPKKKATKHKK